MTLLIDWRLRDILVEYLATRPYGEVHLLIAALATLEGAPFDTRLEKQPNG